MAGFDLTSFAVPEQPVHRSVAPAPQPVQQPVVIDPNAPQTMEEALTKPVGVDSLVDEEGQEFQDKLAKQAPGLKRQLWQVDKFAGKPRIVQVQNKDGQMVYVDANGNVPVDPSTGRILTKPPTASDADRREINYTDSSNSNLSLAE